MKKRILTILMAFVMTLVFIPFFNYDAYASTNDHTEAEAVAWARNMADSHTYCGECVALIQKYYEWLGASVPNTYANTYADEYHIPPGWHVDNTPSLGAVYVESNYSPGHVSIVVGIDSAGTLTTVDSNVENSPVGQYNAQYFPGTTGRKRSDYAGVAGKSFVHPDFTPAPQNVINCTTVFPEKAPVGTVINLTGTITSDYNVGSVVMQLYRGGDIYRSYDSGVMSTKSFDMSRANSALNLSDLPAGWYTLNVAMANDISRETASYAFKLYEPTNNRIELDKEIPACFEVGSDVSISGRATTRYTVGSVIANVTDTIQNKRIASYDSGLINVKSLEFTAMAKSIDLSNLEPGKYRLTIAMSNNPDESVVAERIEKNIEFVVVPKGANSIDLTCDPNMESVPKGTRITFGGNAKSVYSVGSVIAQLSDSNNNIVASFDSGLIDQETFPLSELNSSIKTDALEAGKYKLVIAMSNNPSGYVPSYRISKIYHINITDKGGNADDSTNPTKPSSPVGKGATAEEAEKAIMSAATDEGPAGTEFGFLKLKSSKQTKSSVSLKWSNVSGAANYVIYGNKCGTTNKMKKLASSAGNAMTVKAITGDKVRKGTYYKFIVVALDKNNKVVSTSKVIHVATKGGKVGNYKSVSVSKSVIKKAKSLKKGKPLKLKAKAIKASNLKVKNHRPVAYESSNNNVATVSKKGVVKAKNKGTCYIYAYAQNGVFKSIKVVVK